MEKLKIHENNHPVLRKKCLPVTKVSDTERDIFKSMLNVMRQKEGIGLAASQIGILKQMIVIDIGQGPLELVNPQIIKRRKKKCLQDEGCLSLPGLTVKVSRHLSVSVKALDKFGKEVLIDADGLLARVLQHEIDHLSGRLITDYLPWYKRFRISKTFKND